jgi:ATP-dependent Clp protease protease subunit
MLHQPSGGSQGTAADIEIQAREILWLKKRLYEILAEHTGRTVEALQEDSERDYWLSAKEAMEYGIIDTVLAPPKKKSSKNGKH